MPKNGRDNVRVIILLRHLLPALMSQRMGIECPWQSGGNAVLSKPRFGTLVMQLPVRFGIWHIAPAGDYVQLAPVNRFQLLQFFRPDLQPIQQSFLGFFTPENPLSLSRNQKAGFPRLQTMLPRRPVPDIIMILRQHYSGQPLLVIAGINRQSGIIPAVVFPERAGHELHAADLSGQTSRRLVVSALVEGQTLNQSPILPSPAVCPINVRYNIGLWGKFGAVRIGCANQRITAGIGHPGRHYVSLGIFDCGHRGSVRPRK